MPDEIIVFSTCSSTDEAEKIAEELLNHRLAACVNIIPKVSSLYWWKGKIEHSEEALLLIKSVSELLNGIIELVKKSHSYSVPEVVSLPISGGNVDYLDWLRGEVSRPRLREE